METTIECRNLAYSNILPELSDRRAEVLGVFCSTTGGYTAKQVSSFLKRPINTVVGRINELVGLGLLEPSTTIFDLNTKARCTIYKAVEKPELRKKSKVDIKKYKRMSGIIKQYNQLAAEGNLLEHEIIERLVG